MEAIQRPQIKRRRLELGVKIASKDTSLDVNMDIGTRLEEVLFFRWIMMLTASGLFSPFTYENGTYKYFAPPSDGEGKDLPIMILIN